MKSQDAKAIGCLPAFGILLTWFGCVVGIIPYIGLFGWPIALLGLLIVWISPISTADKLTFGLVPVLLLIALYIYIFIHFVH